VRNRCRLSEIPKSIKYIIAPPRMKLYIDYAADIYDIFLNYFAPEDIHVYSIDESFIDVTGYLTAYGRDPKALAKQLMNEIAYKLQIPSTAGIGTNLYLAKIALDITAKHASDHMGYLTEELYRETLWDHQPLSDFWMVSTGTVKRLSKHGAYTMRQITQMPEELVYKLFGKDAELLIDHAWGRESCLMEDIKNYRPKSHSVSFSQILMHDYRFDEARVVMQEMVLHGAQELMRRKVITPKVWIGVGYTHGTIPSAKKSVKLLNATSVNSLLQGPVMDLFDKITDRTVPIRRLAISFLDVVDEGCGGYDFFTDWQAVEREKARERAVLEITDRYGKNALLRGTNFMEGATQRARNQMIGGHRAGYDETRRTSETVCTLRCHEGTAGSPAGPGRTTAACGAARNFRRADVEKF